MKSIIAVAVLTLSSCAFVGCASHSEEGVTSDYRSQWTTVSADTVATTDAAKSVLSDRGLKDVSGTSTKVDGSAMGKEADGTAVKVAVKKVAKNDNQSQVSVTVGTLGDPTLGAEIAKAIKTRAEGASGSMNRSMNNSSGNLSNDTSRDLDRTGHNAADATRDATHNAADATRDATHNAADATRDATHNAADAARDATNSTGSSGSDMSR